jgi:predicted Zn-dependent protease
MPISTRRDFLTTSGVLLAGFGIGVRPLTAAIPVTQTPEALVSDPLTSDVLRALASRAIEAAAKAGATYADIRVADRQWFGMALKGMMVQPTLNMSAQFSYGVRVLVDGVWAFVHGRQSTPDALVASAQLAVRRARGYATILRQRSEMAPAPAAAGTWQVPVAVDPFTVPMREQLDLLGACNDAYMRVHGISGQSSRCLSWFIEFLFLE